MKSSMSSLARSRGSTTRPLTAPPSKRARTSRVSRSSAPCSRRRARRRCAAASCRRRFSANPSTAASAGGISPSSCEPRPDGPVGELGVVVHERPADVLRHHRAALVHGHPDDDREAVLTGVQRGEVGAQAVGQHGEDARRRVDGGRVDAGVGVDRRAGRDGRGHVGDRHQDPRAAVHLALRDGELIQVLRVVVVDGAPEQLAQVGRGGAVRGDVGQRAGLGQRLGRELRLQAVLDHRLARDAHQQVALLLPGRLHRCSSFSGPQVAHSSAGVTDRAMAGAGSASSWGRRRVRSTVMASAGLSTKCNSLRSSAEMVP